jgi:GTP-binding protein Era
MDVAGRVVVEADMVLYVLDASRHPGKEEEAIAEKLLPQVSRLVVAINKMDSPGADQDGVWEFLQKYLPGLEKDRCFPLSALNNEGIDPLVAKLFELAPEGDILYPQDYYTDQDPSFRITEIIREQAIKRLRQELPHSLYVEVADSELREGDTKLWVRAFIIMERESQKGMVVGQGGRMIKAIREASLKELNAIFDWEIELDLRVKTAKDWRHNDTLLRRITEGGR